MANGKTEYDFEPFVYTKENDIKYGFTLVPYEAIKTIPTLWGHVKEFIRIYPHLIEKDNIFDFITDYSGDYNMWKDAFIHTIVSTLFLKKHQMKKYGIAMILSNTTKGNGFQSKCNCNPDGSY
ncbi:23800_t:CDS:2, partial [Gigaspora margarita]